MRPQVSAIAADAGFHPLVEAVVEAAPDALVVVDAGGRIGLTNAQTEQLFGYPRDELLGQSIETLIPQRFRSGHAQPSSSATGMRSASNGCWQIWSVTPSSTARTGAM